MRYNDHESTIIKRHHKYRHCRKIVPKNALIFQNFPGPLTNFQYIRGRPGILIIKFKYFPGPGIGIQMVFFKFTYFPRFPRTLLWSLFDSSAPGAGGGVSSSRKSPSNISCMRAYSVLVSSSSPSDSTTFRVTFGFLQGSRSHCQGHIVKVTFSRSQPYLLQVMLYMAGLRIKVLKWPVYQ